MNSTEEPNERIPMSANSQAWMAGLSGKATLLFGVLLLLFIQTLTVWLESIYKVGLTRLAMGPEMAGLFFAVSPFVLLLCPARAQRVVLWIAVSLFLIARALLPLIGVAAGTVLAGVGVGAFLVALCLLLSRPFRFLLGDAGIALGLAILLSIVLRAWGASYDFTLGRSGAALGWLLAGIALGLFGRLHSTAAVGSPLGQSPPGRAFGPVIGLFANLTIVHLVLSSPGVVEAWLGFDNTWGMVVCVLALGGAVLILLRGFKISHSWLVVWNVSFAFALVGGILALRIVFPATPDSPAVVVRPENSIAWLLLNLMFLLSPVVLLNVQAACRRLGEAASARSLATPVFLGCTLLVLLTIMSIFTNVWGYVGPASAIFRNQFHVPFLLVELLLIGTLLLKGRPSAAKQIGPHFRSTVLVGLTLVLIGAALAGTWNCRPVTAMPAGNRKQLTILSYNLQQGADLAGNRNWENQLALIKTINADIVGLQESDTPRPSNGNVAAAKYFGARLGYRIYYGPNTVSGTYGTAILSRFPLKNPRAVFVFSDEDEVATAVAEVEVDGKTIAFFNSHPSGQVPRKLHAEELVKQAKPYEYVIAVGDYNTTPQEEPYRIVSAQLKDSWREKHPDGAGLMHPVLRPRGGIRPHPSSGQLSLPGDKIAMPGRIDHIFISKPFRVEESFYLPAPDSQTDHPAHWSVVAWE